MVTINIDRLRELIAARGRKMREVSLSAGLSETGVRDIINGKSKNPSIATLSSIAEELDVDVEALIGDGIDLDHRAVKSAKGIRVAARSAMLPLRREARPGAWLEHDDAFELGHAAAPIDPRWPRNLQWMTLVRGDSMNDLRRGEACIGIIDGDFAQVVDAEAIGYEPTTDDIVEVERTREDEGQRFSEISIRQVEVASDGKVLLWSRSSNRRWKEPVEIIPGENAQARIIGRVIRLLRDL
jgi:transcriptional regulator with XRE-family HTH domain